MVIFFTRNVYFLTKNCYFSLWFFNHHVLLLFLLFLKVKFFLFYFDCTCIFLNIYIFFNFQNIIVINETYWLQSFKLKSNMLHTCLKCKFQIKKSLQIRFTDVGHSSYRSYYNIKVSRKSISDGSLITRK